MRSPNLFLFGDDAVRFLIPARLRGQGGVVEALRRMDGVRDVVLAEEMGCLIFFRGGARPLNIDHALETALASVVGDGDEDARCKHRIDVVYDGEDLETVAAAIGRSREEVIALHSDATYRVAMLGFMPGFAYMRGLPPELVLPRRASPRARVPKNSVAIAADYAGIYPFASPGGWNLLGRAVRFRAFHDDHHAAFAVGDLVTFIPTSAADEDQITSVNNDDVDAPTHRPHLEITRAAGFAIAVRDESGRMHEGIPPGGALVRSACARANRLVGNADDACAIEIVGSFEVTARHGDIRLGSSDTLIHLREGASHRIDTTGRERVRYLAVEGGLDAPFVPGPRSPLRRGDRIVAACDPRAKSSAIDEPTNNINVIEILPGPDHVEGAWELLTSKQAFRISSSSNRIGVRLEAPSSSSSLHASSSLQAASSTPMVMGAIELTPSGLIVLGPDHPTTGGYPVVAVVRSRSLDSFFATPIGGSVYFSEES